MNKKVVIGGLIGCGAIVVISVTAMFFFLYYIGSEGPETRIVTGFAVNKDYKDTMQNLGLLEEGETIEFFYSDAMVDITDGMYVLTDRKLILYSTAWSQPYLPVTFTDIVDLNITRDESFFVDSMVYLETRDGTSVEFPLSSEGNLDVQFYEKLDTRRQAPSE